MAQVWAPEVRFQKMLEVEIAVAQVQAQLKMIPRSAAVEIAKKAKVSVARIEEIEKTTKHDVIAFVTVAAESVGPAGRYIHYGLTSSDVLDTALSLQLRDACEILDVSLQKLDRVMESLVKRHKNTLCLGRTHGMWAEPTTFGFKVAGFLAELRRNRSRFARAAKQIQVCKMSGAVGTYSSLQPEVESRLAKRLKLLAEPLATQVVPRDRHAELLASLAFIGGGLERLAIELRHLQRSEVGEVVEGFSKGQKGSSAMPHKKNPISAENISGCARLLRSYMAASFENVALWHERDISHSSVERVILPDAFILCDYMIDRMTQLLKGLHVDKERMQENVDDTRGLVFSSQVLLQLIEKGLSREEAYTLVQNWSHHLAKGETLRQKIESSQVVGSKSFLKSKELDLIFSGARNLKNIDYAIQRVLELKLDLG
jgi:adenylosuccinate lyase